MSSPSLQSHIGQRLHVSAEIDPAKTAQLIVDFLQQYLDYAGAAGYVLGVSGGQDSTLCARLAQMAVEAYTRHTGKSTALWAMRLPCGVQSDEADALLALDFIRPTRVVVWNIQEAVEASARAFEKATGTCISDYHKGNIKARERMIAQYAVAGQHGLLVLGTDHAAEAVTGFFTKHGDGACDLTPLAGLTKRQGKQLLRSLGAPTQIINKIPTADLEDQLPMRADEDALGVTYAQIDAYLEKTPCAPDVVAHIESGYLRTRHKREPPVTRFDTWWRER